MKPDSKHKVQNIDPFLPSHDADFPGEELIKLLQQRTAVLENLEEALTLVGLDGQVLYRNQASLKLHGYDSQENAKFPKALFYEHWQLKDLDGKDIPLSDWPLNRALRGEKFSGYELFVQNLDNGVSYIGSYAGALVEDDDGTPLFAMLTIRDITAQKEAEKALHNEQTLLQAIYDRIPIMLTIYDPKLNQITLNKHVERVTGWSALDAEKTSILELTYPDPAYRKFVSSYMKSLKPGFQDIYMVTKSGSIVETSWANVKIPDGRQVGIGINLTERINAEKALQRYSIRLKFLHEVDEAILAASSEKEVAEAVVMRIPDWLPECDQACVTVPDYEKQTVTLLANSSGRSNDADDTWSMPEQSFWLSMQKSLQAGKKYSLEDLDQIPPSSPFRRFCLQKSVRTCIFHPILVNGELIGTLNLGKSSSGPFTDEQNEIILELLIPLTIGMEQARLHERSLQISRRLLETVINNIPVGVTLIRGSDLKILYANPTYYAISPEKNLIGKTLNDIWRAGEIDYVGLCRQVLESSEPFLREDDETQIIRSNSDSAETAYFTWWLFPIDIPNEDEMGILNMAYETTNRKLAELALIEAERLSTISRMASSLAHEINNPIQSVVGCLGLARELQNEGEDASKFMEVATKELVRASRIVQRLRDLTRSGDDGVREFGDIVELVEKLLILTRKQALDQSITVVFNYPDKCPSVLMSPDRIRQVFLNIILNAIEAMPTGGNLTIETTITKNPDGIQVKFIDTGVGIEPKDIALLFDAFHSTKQLGLGMGLHVSRRIVNQHGGRISVDSEPGRGSTFTVWLPGDLPGLRLSPDK